MEGLAAFRLRVAELIAWAQERGADDDLLMDITDGVRELADELQSRRTHRKTRALAARIVKLEAQLADRDPGERAEIVRLRLGLSKSTYYRLRAVPENSGTRARDICGT
jgi:hypothetical protein